MVPLLSRGIPTKGIVNQIIDVLKHRCFSTISSGILNAAMESLTFNENAKIVTDRHTVKLPLRVNWGGGWSDTPPYCNENCI